MDQETIQKIAAQIAGYLPSHAWVLLLIQTVVLLVAAGVGAFFGEYLKTRGKNLATKADFDNLQNQLRANTELVEKIKAEVGQRDWARREWTNLRRIKLEALLVAVDNCDTYLGRYRLAAIEGKFLEERDPHGEVDTIATLYLPELGSAVSAYSVEFRNQILKASALGRDILAVSTDLNARQKVFEEYQKTVDAELGKTTVALKAAARELLVKIMDVDEQRP